MKHELKTIRGYAFGEVASALQKAIRRADARLAGYWTIELFESGYREYLWRRLLTISAEDCLGRHHVRGRGPVPLLEHFTLACSDCVARPACPAVI